VLCESFLNLRNASGIHCGEDAHHPVSQPEREPFSCVIVFTIVETLGASRSYGLGAIDLQAASTILSLALSPDPALT